MGDLLGIDLVSNPDLALNLDVSVRILFEGMARGLFTGKKLADYFNLTTDDPVGARRIVNKQDKAQLIAGFHKNFLDAIQAAQAIVRPPDVSKDLATPDGPALAKDKTVWSVIAGGAALFAAGIFGAINNPYAFGALALLAVAGIGLAIYFRREIREQFGG